MLNLMGYTACHNSHYLLKFNKRWRYNIDINQDKAAISKLIVLFPRRTRCIKLCPNYCKWSLCDLWIAGNLLGCDIFIDPWYVLHIIRLKMNNTKHNSSPIILSDYLSDVVDIFPSTIHKKFAMYDKCFQKEYFLNQPGFIISKTLDRQ